ncbi:hypothetical protein NJB93_07430 [Brucella intermedia]|uniref:hypothetical protein n=1 Tax=Brucella intermedia TaxID=94625 RepID=UPI0020976722|nr:hypothetical protein [Brucella intermedia]MCO7726424.1 hypothetical protein [Brucella intermedia]
MTDLITRLSKLDAPDREVDAEIAVLFSGDPDAYVVRPNEGAMFSHKPGWFATGDNKSHKSPEYTTSVDAAIALAERVLPGWTFEHIGQDYIRASGLDNDVMPMGWTVEISDGSQTIQGQAPTLPLAICIALLRAKEASKL